MGIKTKDVVLEGGALSPLLTPGNHKVKLNELEIVPDARFGDKLILNVEGPAVNGGWKGFMKDPKDSSKGTFAGQVGKVLYSKFGFSDDAQYNRSRNDDLIKALGTICRDLGLTAFWTDFEDAYPQANTPEDFVKIFNQAAPFKDVWFHTCIAGRPWKTRDGKYTNYELYFPRAVSTLSRPFSVQENHVMTFNRDVHIDTLKGVVAEKQEDPLSFGNTTSDPGMASYTKEVEEDFQKQQEGLGAPEFTTKAQSNNTLPKEDKLPWE